MSRLIVYTARGEELLRRELDCERIRIGRRPDNEIVLEDPLVSAEHALVTTLGNDSFIQDLDSRNGVRVNGRLVRHHHLQGGDQVAIGSFLLRFEFEPWVEPEPAWQPETLARKAEIVRAVQAGADTLFLVAVETTSAAHSGSEGELGGETGVFSVAHARPTDSGETASARAGLRLLDGPGAGRETLLAKAVTTLGKPGIQTALIANKHGQYFLLHAEGERYPRVNRVEVGAAAHPLQDHDVIEIAGTRLEFFRR